MRIYNRGGRQITDLRFDSEYEEQSRVGHPSDTGETVHVLYACLSEHLPQNTGRSLRHSC